MANKAREHAMAWWNTLSSPRKTQICDTSTELVGHVRRWESLTGREIESIYLNQTDITFDILSPDGIPIEFSSDYKTPDEAKEAFERWKKNFEKQGYYSSNNGRIPLDELENNCKLISY